ncbi:MAG: HAD-IIB family hydrolase [Promicromonosporaceae bacterium]|nr:HAD-IIB family hydrolase [Promicromonosporaceae bacterium]
MTEAAAVKRKIIFTDIDGTIYEHEIIDQSAAVAIAAARAAGNLVFLCTGRAAGLVPREIRDIGFDGAITNGGADIWIDDALVFSYAFPPEQVTELIKYFSSRDIPFALQSEIYTYATDSLVELFEKMFTERRQSQDEVLTRLSLPADAVAHTEWETFRPISAADLDKVGKVVFESPLSETISEVRELFGANYYIVGGSLPTDSGSSGEISPPHITKGTAIEWVLAKLGLPRENSIGIGDSWNDQDMFRACGIAVAMGNAPEELQRLADLVTTPVLADGVKNALTRLNLI